VENCLETRGGNWQEKNYQGAKENILEDKHIHCLNCSDRVVIVCICLNLSNHALKYVLLVPITTQ
jgi:hypothetical protein